MPSQPCSSSYAETLYDEVAKIRNSWPRADLANHNVLILNLCVMYHIIRASENLLDVASAEEHNLKLIRFYVDHHTEEKDHQKWLAEDLKPYVDVAKVVIPSGVVELVGSIYYLIYHVDAAALLGYMLVLECFPMDLVDLEYLERIHGKELLRTLRHHAEHDVAHGKDILEMIDYLSEDRRWIVGQTAMNTVERLGRLLQWH